MPKNSQRRKTNTGGIIRSRPRTKLRIGTRKSGKSALHMTTDALKDVLNDTNKARYHQRARTALAKRGAMLEWHEPLVATHQTHNDDMQANTAG